jgi:DNA-directed RNA polymerase subunit M/transcription elongation factor TFIIS
MIVYCPRCNKKLAAREGTLGKRVKCPSCGEAFAVPAVPSATVRLVSEAEVPDTQVDASLLGELAEAERSSETIDEIRPIWTGAPACPPGNAGSSTESHGAAPDPDPLAALADAMPSPASLGEAMGANESSLISCPDCGREVSRLAATCPQCGRPFDEAVSVRTASIALRNEATGTKESVAWRIVTGAIATIAWPVILLCFLSITNGLRDMSATWPVRFCLLFGLSVSYVISIWAFTGLPGAIARNRGHPSATAINVCAWVGIVTLGVFWWVALIWAYTSPKNTNR